MKIDSGTIGMESARSYKTSYVTMRRFEIKEYQNALNTAITGGEDDELQEQTDSASKQEDMAEEVAEVVTPWQERYSIPVGRVNLRSSADQTINDLRQYTFRYIFDMLFAARRERLSKWMEINGWGGAQSGSMADINSGQVSASQTTNIQQTSNVQSGLFVTNMRVLNYSQETMYLEEENTSFSTVGTVRTADGREISFNVQVAMSRRFEQYYREDLQLATFQMCDPLVINLDTDVAELSDQKFFFDIDVDGEEDEISMLSESSGYLALDQNGDGIINDGSELFGTKSGDGFADLAKYDKDGNGWIDENDAIWSKLQIWCKDEDGKDILYRLADKGVGAICLQNAATDFTLKKESGDTNGAIRKTGIFLYENGNVGTIQHVDVAKYLKQA